MNIAPKASGADCFSNLDRHNLRNLAKIIAMVKLLELLSDLPNRAVQELPGESHWRALIDLEIRWRCSIS